jgi:very-short-patch-repair endonuclease
MNVFIILIVVVLVIVVALVALKAKAASQTSQTTVPELSNANVVADLYRVKKSIFSPAERSFVGVLETVDLGAVTIATKVRLADIFEVKKGLNRGDWQRAFNRITSKHVDFPLVQSGDCRPILGIELDDSSHAEEDRADRDSFVDTVFASGGLPILHVAARATYNPEEIRRQITGALASTTGAKSMPSAAG